MRKPQALLPSPVEIPRAAQVAETAQPESQLQLGRLARTYALPVIALVAVGILAGFAVLLRQTPVYRAQMMLEVNPINEAYVRTSLDPLSGNMDPNAINIATQIRLLQTGPVLSQVWQTVVHEPPPPPIPPDSLSNLRRRFHRTPHSSIDQLRAAGMAVESFEARAVSGTRLIELTTESTHPLIASEFLNQVAGTFIDDSDQNRVESSARTTQWLSSQLKDVTTQLNQAEDKLQTFVQRYGADFAISGESGGPKGGSATTLYNTELKGLQADLAAAQADRVTKQAKYEAAEVGNIEDLPEVMDDMALKEIETKLAALRDEKRTLDRILTPNHPKIQRLEAEEQDLIEARKTRAGAIVGRLKSEYEASMRKQKLLSDEYDLKGRTVISQASEVTEYSALRRAVDELQANHDTLSQRLTQAGAASALPVSLIRIVQKCVPPDKPYTPKPSMTMGMGAMAGLALAFGMVLLKEKSDKSVKAPGAMRGVLDLPELGVIPEANRLIRNRGQGSGAMLDGLRSRLLPDTNARERVAWVADKTNSQPGVAVMVESFRFTLASLMREVERTRAKVIMITSAQAGEGKTTITANLGVALAERGKRVAIVDADLRRPRIHEIFDLPNTPSVSQILQETKPIDEYSAAEIMTETCIPGLFAVPGGEFAGNIAPLIYSERLGLFIKRLRREYDFVFVDVSPITILADARVIGSHVDAAALVIRCGHTESPLAVAAAQYLADDGVPLLGTILNRWAPDKGYWHRYEKYYGQAV